MSPTSLLDHDRVKVQQEITKLFEGLYAYAHLVHETPVVELPENLFKEYRRVTIEDPSAKRRPSLWRLFFPPMVDKKPTRDPYLQVACRGHLYGREVTIFVDYETGRPYLQFYPNQPAVRLVRAELEHRSISELSVLVADVTRRRTLLALHVHS